MQERRLVVLLLLLLQGCVRGQAYTCLSATNFLNAQYTVSIGVGTPPQNLSCVMDTGSFELLVASDECTGCGDHKKYRHPASSTFEPKVPEELITTVFGQGKVISEAVYENAKVGDITVAHQSVLMMKTNELRDYGDAAYDGVVGLGVSNAARNGDADLSLMSQMGVDKVSICFGQHNGEPGRVEFGVNQDDGLEFKELPVIGDQHWAVELSTVGIRGNDGATLTINGCEQEGCNAIVDSGTSLIAVPTNILNSMLDVIGDIDPDCNGVCTLRTVSIALGIALPTYSQGIGRLSQCVCPPQALHT